MRLFLINLIGFASHFSFFFFLAFSREVIFNTSSDGSFNGLVFENQYLEISTQLEPNANIYGFGEQVIFFFFKYIFLNEFK